MNGPITDVLRLHQFRYHVWEGDSNVIAYSMCTCGEMAEGEFPEHQAEAVASALEAKGVKL